MRTIWAYILTLAICGFAIWLTLSAGESIQDPGTVKSVSKIETQAEAAITKGLHDNLRAPLGILLTQIVLIVLCARLLGMLAVKLGQPQVIGEMIGGILLGPSFLGLFSPATMEFVFPPSSMGTLQMFSQIGVIIFMFLVGTDVDLQHLFQRAHTTLLVSHASIVLPFMLGTTLSLFIYRTMAPPAIPFNAFALFMGVAMSITAFPVLARIVEERGLTLTNLGIMSLGCAAVGDVTAWCILAVVLAIVKADRLGGSLLTMLLVLIYAGVMIFLLKPFLRWLVPAGKSSDFSATSKSHYNAWAALILAFALTAGLATEVIGVHALFGAFLAGAIIPAGDLRSYCKERFESVASGLLLPLFFAFTGLRTQITLLNNVSTWLIFGAVIAAAVAGKLGGSMLAARWSGMKWRDSFALGALMNTRGLMELIVLNIGYDLGILSARIFAILVLMALTTTLMTAPLLSLARRSQV